MTDAFAGLFHPVIGAVIDLLRRVEDGEDPDVGAERAAIVALLGEAEQKAASSSQLAADFRVARPGLIYWVDEVLINSRWRSALEWKNHILEWEFFGQRERADRFFELAHQAELLAGTDPLEAFYLWVAMGFRGKFADDPAGLAAWSDRVYQRVVSGMNQPERFLPDSPAEAAPPAPLPGPSVLLAVSILVALTALFSVACFVVAVPPWD
jgi:type VI secretion system protein ImpK